MAMQNRMVIESLICINSYLNQGSFLITATNVIVRDGYRKHTTNSDQAISSSSIQTMELHLAIEMQVINMFIYEK